MRNLTRSLMTFNGARNSVIKVQWSPFNSCILSAGGHGRNVDIWDVSKESKEQELTLKMASIKEKLEEAMEQSDSKVAALEEQVAALVAKKPASRPRKAPAKAKTAKPRVAKTD